MPQPTKFTPERARAILDQIEQGEFLEVICRQPGQVSSQTFRNWMNEGRQLRGEPLAVAYARARDLGADAIARETLEIADYAAEDTVIRTRPDGSEYEATNSEHIQRSKLRVETRLKLLSKWFPHKYGELLKLSGPDGKSPVAVTQLTAEMSPEQAAEAYAKMIQEL